MTKYPYELTTLPSGLRVISAEMLNMESVALGVWAAAGGRCESAALSGISHFVEHLCFKGTKQRTARQISQAIESVGGTLNGFTGEEVTCYYAKVRYPDFERAMDVLNDIYRNSTFPDDEMERERKVIKEEVRMYQDMPQQVAYDDLTRIMWPDHPLGRSLLGTFETIDGLTKRDLLRYRREHYTPRATVVSVVGHIPHKAVLAAVEGYMGGPWQAGTPAPMLPVQDRQRHPRVHTRTKQAEQAHLLIGFRAFSRTNPDRYPLRVLSTILGENMSSRLNHEIREKRGLAYEVDSSIACLKDTGALRISVGTDPANAAKALKLILAICADVAEHSVRERELKHAKVYVRSHIALALERTTEYMLWLGESMLISNEVLSIEDIMAAYERVTLADVQRAARAVFANKGLSVALVSPKVDEAQIKDLARV